MPVSNLSSIIMMMPVIIMMPSDRDSDATLPGDPGQPCPRRLRVTHCQVAVAGLPVARQAQGRAWAARGPGHATVCRDVTVISTVKP